MPNPIDLYLYLVLDANLCPTPEQMVETALEAVRGGATVVQLRAPEWKKRKQLDAALLLKKALCGTGVPLIIDDHLDIALICRADGVHVGQADLPVNEVRKLMGKNVIIGLSVGSQEEMQTVTEDVDYLGIGPVFATTTKKDAGKAIGLQELKALKKQTSLPVVAIGGINESNAKETMLTGVDGIAVVSAICGAASPYEATKKLRAEIKDGD